MKNQNSSYVNILKERSLDQIRALVTHLNLRYGDDLFVPKKRAFQQATAKALYVLGTQSYHSFSEVHNAVSELIGTNSVTPQRITESLDALRKNRYADRKKDRWCATKVLVDDTEVAIDNESRRREGILRSFWGSINGISDDELRNWYIRASAAVFTEFGKQWLHSISKGHNAFSVSREDVERCLSESVIALDLSRYHHDLIAGYHRFMQDTTALPALERWHLGRSMFYAEIISYDQSADPLAVDEFRDCHIFLDTNVLIVAVLDAHEFHDPLLKLIEVLQQLNSMVCFTYDTLNEYNRVLTTKYDECKVLWDKFELSALKEAKDTFVQAALNRGVISIENLEVFFHDISDLKNIMIDDYQVSYCETGEYENALQKGRNNENSVSRIRNIWATKRKREKTRSACEHDAALAELVNYIRRDKHEKCFLLTNDLTLTSLAKSWNTHDNMPFCLSFDAVLQVLAVEGSGPVIPEQMVASLMADILRSQIYQEKGNLYVDELVALGKQDETLKKFSREEAEELITHCREAISQDTINREEELAHFFKIRLKNKQLDTSEGKQKNAEERAKAAEEESNRLRQKEQESKTQFDKLKQVNLTRLKSKIHRNLYIKLTCITIGFVVIYMFGFYKIWNLLQGSNIPKFASDYDGFIVLFLQVLWIFPFFLIKNLRRLWLDNLDKKAETLLKKEIANHSTLL